MRVFHHKLMLAFLLSGILYGAPSSYIDITPRQARIGDLISVNLILEFDENIEIKAPSLNRESQWGEFIVLESTLQTERRKSKPYKNSYLIKVTVLDTGFQALPPLQILWRDRVNGEWQSLETDSQFVYIHSSLKNLENIAEIYTPQRISILSSGEWLTLIILLILTAGLLFYGLRSRKRIPQEKIAAPPLSPEALAQKALYELAEKKLPLKGLYKDFYVELTFILKRYLEQRYYIHIIELSTTELLPVLEETVTLQEFSAMKSLLQGADLVKFAAQKSSIERCTQDFNLVEQLVLMARNHVTENSQEAGFPDVV